MVLEIIAASVDEKLLDYINSEKKMIGIVHSIFRNTMNLYCNGNLITIAISSLDNAPFTIRIDEAYFKKLQLSINDPVYITNQGIKFSDKYRIILDDQNTWSAKYTKFPNYDSELSKNVLTAMDHLKNRNLPNWAFENQDNHSSNKMKLESHMDELLLAATKELYQDTLNISEPDTQNTLINTKLIGLGRGLTPSGDDVLSGFSMVAAMENYPVDLTNIFAEWDKRIKLKTNEISAASIYHSCQGNGREIMHSYLYTLVNAFQSNSIVSELESVLRIGSSSGSEIALGMTLAAKVGCEILKKRENRRIQ